MSTETTAETQQKNYEAANPENQRAEEAGKDGTADRERVVNKDKIDSLEENKENLKTDKFAVKGSTVEVKETDDNLIVENIPVQALGQDRDGDKITEEGQKQIVKQLKSGEVPAFPNHGIGDFDAIYDFRDIMGQWIDGRHEDSMTYGDLKLRKGNEAAEHLKDLLKQDMPVGFSVGFIPKEFDESKGQDVEGEAIKSLDLMEISPVGIPSKPEAVNELEDEPVAMAKSIMKNNEEEGKDKNPAEFSKQFTKELKNAMSRKDESEQNVQEEDGKSEDEQNNAEKELSQKFNEDEIEEIMGVVGGAVESHVNEAMQEIEEQLQEDEENPGEEEETEEDGDYGEDEEEEEDSAETDSGHTEESEQDSTEPENQDSETDTEQEKNGLDEDEKTVNDSDSEPNKINTVEDSEDKDTDTEQQEKSEGNDPFVITEDSKA